MRWIIYILLFFAPLAALAQGEIFGEDRVYSLNESTFSGELYSNGWGISYRYGKRLDGFRKRLISVELAYVKHPKEIRVQNPYYENQKRFVFGKINTFFVLRAGIGLQKEIFSKFDKGGVSIKYFYDGGVSLGLLKPIYYQVVDSSKVIDNKTYIYIGTKQFDENIHNISDIYGRASFFKGFSETKLLPGIYGRFGLSFEFSSSYQTINAIEAGFLIDLFPSDVPIMDTELNQPYFLSIFVGYRFGKVSQKQ